MQQVADIPPHVRVVEVQLAPRYLRRCRRLPAPLCALHQHRSTRLQLSLQHFIRYSRSVFSSSHLLPFIIHFTSLTCYVNPFLSILDNFYYAFSIKFIVDFGQDLLSFLDILCSLPGDFLLFTCYFSCLAWRGMVD